MVPIVFIAGPSGVGKSYLACCIEKRLGFLHIDIDQRRGFHANGIHGEWNTFETKVNPQPLAVLLRNKAFSNGRAGVVLSFPSDRFFSRQKIDVGRAVGILTIILWGTKEACKAARLNRDGNMGYYNQKNALALKNYGSAEYCDVRVEAFDADGLRHSCEGLLEIIQPRIAEVHKNFLN